MSVGDAIFFLWLGWGKNHKTWLEYCHHVEKLFTLEVVLRKGRRFCECAIGDVWIDWICGLETDVGMAVETRREGCE